MLIHRRPISYRHKHDPILDRAVSKLRTTTVLMAHPTDTMHWQLNEALACIAHCLERRMHADELERATCDAALLTDDTALWQSSAHRHRKPTPVDEVRHAIHTLETMLVHAVGHGKHERGFC